MSARPVRRFHFSQGSSNKFWEVWTEGAQLFTRYGRLGAGGQTTVKALDSADSAETLAQKLVREKTSKGYVEQGAAPVPLAPPALENGFERYVRDGVFWDIKTVGVRQRIRTGAMGTSGTLTEKFFDRSGDAKADSKAAVAAKVKQGFRRAKAEGALPATVRDPAIEAQIEQAPDDAGAYLVYADVLQTRGDPLGELIVLQHRGLRKKAEALLKKHAEHFWGRLAKPSQRTLEPEWRNGFLKGLKFGWPMYGGDGETEQDCVDDLNALLDLPIARFLERLDLGPVTWNEEGEGMSFQVVIDTLVARQRLPTLRALSLGDIGDWDISSTSTGAFAPLAPVVPRLQKLTLHAGELDLGKDVSLPELTSLSLETGSLTKADLAALWTLGAPKLESLEMWFGDPNYGASGSVADVAPLLAGTRFPRLRHLGLMNASFTDTLIEPLAKSKVLARLTSVDLSLGTLTDAGLETLLAHKRAFAHLERLNLERNALSAAARRRAAGLAKTVTVGRQDEDREGRYPAVGE